MVMAMTTLLVQATLRDLPNHHYDTMCYDGSVISHYLQRIIRKKNVITSDDYRIYNYSTGYKMIECGVQSIHVAIAFSELTTTYFRIKRRNNTKL